MSNRGSEGGDEECDLFTKSRKFLMLIYVFKICISRVLIIKFLWVGELTVRTDDTDTEWLLIEYQ